MHFNWTTTKTQWKVATPELANGCRVLQSDCQLCFKTQCTRKLRAPSGAILTSSLHSVMLVGGFTPPGFNNLFLKGTWETTSFSISLPAIPAPKHLHLVPQSVQNNIQWDNILLKMSDTVLFPWCHMTHEGKANIRVTGIIYACWHSRSTGWFGALFVRKDLLEERWGEAKTKYGMAVQIEDSLWNRIDEHMKT